MGNNEHRNASFQELHKTSLKAGDGFGMISLYETGSCFRSSYDKMVWRHQTLIETDNLIIERDVMSVCLNLPTVGGKRCSGIQRFLDFFQL